jgi:hypothetical protein
MKVEHQKLFQINKKSWRRTVSPNIWRGFKKSQKEFIWTMKKIYQKCRMKAVLKRWKELKRPKKDKQSIKNRAETVIPIFFVSFSSCSLLELKFSR